MPTSDDLGRGDVVVVPFPYADILAEKRRPAIVVSGRRLAESGLVWIAMVTSATHAAWPDDIPIVDLPLAGLPHPSVIRPVKIACVSRDRVVRRAGTLDPQTARRLTEILTSLISA